MQQTALPSSWLTAVRVLNSTSVGQENTGLPGLFIRSVRENETYTDYQTAQGC